jgi:hypothetical protein
VYTKDIYNWDESSIRLGQSKALKKVTTLLNITTRRNTSRETCIVSEYYTIDSFAFRGALVIFIEERFIER